MRDVALEFDTARYTEYRFSISVYRGGYQIRKKSEKIVDTFYITM